MARSIRHDIGWRSLQDGAEVQKSLTKASQVYEALRAEIVDGDIAPDHQLAAHTLSNTYSVSVSAIREALNRLTQEGLVVLNDHRGFRVAPANLDDLLEVVHARCRLEEVALRESIRRGGSDWEERVVVAHHRLSRSELPREGTSPAARADWESNHRAFHLALISACDSKFLVKYCGDLQQRLARYRNLSPLKKRRGEHAAEEHLEMRDAALNRDANRAAEMVAHHFKATQELIKSCSSQDSD